MKNIMQISNLNSRFANIAEFDKREIDNPDSNALERLHYLNRMNKIIEVITKIKVPHKQNLIAEFGCAQGNISLLLAEMGYSVYAVDINLSFLEYSKLKYEKGIIQWINGNFDEIEFKENSFDVIILAEILEHCAYPERVLKRLWKFLKKGGLFIITTPNGSYIKNKLPTFTAIQKLDSRENLVKKQFGPDGKDHLFLFTMSELICIIPRNLKIIKQGYLSNRLFCKLPKSFLHNSKTNAKILNFLDKIPVINKYICSGLYMVLKKQICEYCE